jgi:branched-chain amino acid transport system substrate-binding protein
LAAFEALAIDDQIREAKMPIISSSAAAEDLTQRKVNPWFVRASATSAQSNHPLGEYAAKVLGYKRVSIVADDFAYTQEASSGFQRVFEDNGGKVVQKLWTPINATDYAPYLSQIKQDVDAIFLGSAGSNSLRFLRQREEYGMKIPILGTQTVTDEAILRNMGDEALGVITSRWYSAAIDTPANKKFVAEHVKANGYEPGTFSAGGYSGGLFLEQGLIDVKGYIEDKEAFMRALRTMKITNDPRGALTFDDYGNPVTTMFLTKVERVGGRLVNTVVASYPETSQFWKYDPKEFLANPVYSRNWPPARYLE